MIDSLAGRGDARETKTESDDETLFCDWADDDEEEPLVLEDGPSDELDSAIQASEALAAKAEAALRRTGGDHRYPVYDEDWDEPSRMIEFLRVADGVRDLPPSLSAIVVDDAWTVLSPLERAPGVGRLLAAAVLKHRLKTTAHLASIGVGLQAIPFKDRRNPSLTGRYIAGLRALAAAARKGLQKHEEWMTAKAVLEHKLKGRRSNSSLPKLVDLLLSKPLVTTRTIAAELDVSRRAAQDMASELNLREITGRGRFRAWSVF